MINYSLTRALKLTKKRLISITLFSICSFFLVAIPTLKSGLNIHPTVYANWTEKNRLVSEILEADPFKLNRTFLNFPSNLNMLIMIISAAEEFNERLDIRNTWANPEGTNIFLTNKVGLLFVIGRQERNEEKIRQEHAAFGDILQMDTIDTYSNLVYKLLAAYKWASRCFPLAYIVKVDSDVIVRLDKIIETIRQYSNPIQPQILCSINYNVVPSRDRNSRWYISKRSYSSEHLPRYCSGPLYIFSPSIFTRLSREIRNHMVFEVEDAYITGVLAEAADIPLFNVDNFLIQKPHLWNCEPKPVGLLIHQMNDRNIRTVVENLRQFSCLSSWQLLLNFFMTL